MDILASNQPTVIEHQLYILGSVLGAGDEIMNKAKLLP